MRPPDLCRTTPLLVALLTGCIFHVDRSLSQGQLTGTALIVSNGKQVPAAGASVILEASPLSTRTDTKGNFQFNGLPAGTYAVRISLPQGDSGGVGVRMSGLVISPHNGIDLGKFVLAPVGSIVGTVSVNGSPAGPNAIAAIAGLAQVRLANGMYHFPNLPAGTYEVDVLYSDELGVLAGTAPNIQVTASQAAVAPPVSLTTQSSAVTTGGLQGLVQVGGASSDQGATVQFSASGPTLTTSASGGFNSGGVVPGLYTATATLKGFQTVTVPFIVVGSGTAVVPPITLLPGSGGQPDAGSTGCFTDTECPAGLSCILGVCRAGALGASCTTGNNATCSAGPSPLCLSETQGTYCSSSCTTSSDCGPAGACVTNLMALDAGTPDVDGGAPADAGTSGFCVGTCSTDADCASSSLCDSWMGLGGDMVKGCWVACATSADCGLQQTCNSANGHCM
jgi:hypothetical protein